MRKIKRPGNRVIGYARVSTSMQASNGHSLDAQRSAIENYCAERGFVLVDVATDPGESAKSLLRRSQMRATLDRLDGGEADLLVATKLDRVSRSLSDIVKLLERAKDHGWQLVTLDAQLDTTTPSGKALLGMAAVFAEFERALVSERVKTTMAALPRDAYGRRLGRSGKPVGRSVDLDPKVARRIVKARERGETWQAIADWLNAKHVPLPRGGQRWHATSVRRVYERATRFTQMPDDPPASQFLPVP